MWFLEAYGFAILATLIGLIRFRKFIPFLRVIVIQCVLNLLVAVTNRILLGYFHHKNNHWVYLCYVGLEGLILLTAVEKYLQGGLIVKWVRATAVLFLAFWLYILIFSGAASVPTLAIVEAIVLLGWYIYLLYHCVLNEGARKHNSAMWLCLGLILYFAAQVPYMSLTAYLQNLSPDLNFKLFKVIMLVLNNIRYFLTLVAFVVFIPNQIHVNRKPNDQ